MCVSIDGDNSWNESTDTLYNAGSNVTWNNLTMQTEVNRDMLLMSANPSSSEGKLTVVVMDENTSLAGDKLLGTGSVSMRKLCSRIGTEVMLTVDLKTADSGVVVGTVILTAVLKQCALENMDEALPASVVVVQRGQLVVQQIIAQDLKGGNSTLFGAKQVGMYKHVAITR